MITGVRGSGKTVLMNHIANDYEKEEDWIVIRLNPDRDMLQGMLSKLHSDRECSEIFKNAKINLSFFGFGVEISGEPQITDMETAIEKMLKSLKKKKKRVLVTIDEVTCTEYIRIFSSAFQIFVGQELPIFLLMTGLYENIEELQNQKNLTFLYRAPKIKMKPLNMGVVANRYQTIFHLSEEEAHRMAFMTKGYPFAFQALGYSRWNHGDDENEAFCEYRQLLEEYVYEKIWSELSPKDKKIAGGIARCPEGRIKEINELLGLKTDEINQYRKRLIRKGIVDGSEYGRITFTLPYFDAFVLDQMTMD